MSLKWKYNKFGHVVGVCPVANIINCPLAVATCEDCKIGDALAETSNKPPSQSVSIRALPAPTVGAELFTRDAVPALAACSDCPFGEFEAIACNNCPNKPTHTQHTHSRLKNLFVILD